MPCVNTLLNSNQGFLYNHISLSMHGNTQAFDISEIKAGVLPWIIFINLVLRLFPQQLVNFVLDL